ncbi:MAG: hypothetical protein PUD09_06190 [Coriobacteriales bacterium]|nr:hypothetical protein [Coriobacteriales bacterium]
MENAAAVGCMVTLYRQDQGDECREVSATFDAGGYLLVGEKSFGELSRFAYGESHHYHQVALPPDSVDELWKVTYVDPLDERERAAMDGLLRFFEASGAFLSDLMDALDRSGVPYTYLPGAGRVTAAFRPKQTGETAHI